MEGMRPRIEASPHVALEIKWLESIKYRAGMSLRRKPPAKPTIFRVPPSMRCGNQDAYEPKLVSIGPYHRGKSEELKAMEQLKWRLLHNYLSKVPNGSVNEGLRKMKDLEKQARDCYSEVIDLDSDQFVEMLLLDGCFLILIIIAGDKLVSMLVNCSTEVIRSLLVDDEDEVIRSLLSLEIEVPQTRLQLHGRVEELRSLLFKDTANELISLILDNMWLPGLIIRDVLLIENQLPYFIVEHLLDTLEMPGWNSSRLQQGAISSWFAGLLPQYSNVPEPKQSGEVLQVDHLLHLFHKWILSVREEEENYQKQMRSCNKLLPKLPCSVLSRMINASGNCLSKLLPCSNSSERLPPSTVPTTTELAEAGVKIEKTKAHSFLNVSFCKNKGALKIPAIKVGDHTNFFLANLIALEQCRPERGMDITHYTLFLDDIISTPSDVELLHRQGIIHRLLGADEDIASLFNKLGNGVTFNHENSYLKNVYEDLNAYCESRWPRWRAKAVHDYFNNPWAVISLGAAVLLLGLTFLQSVYTVLGFYKN